jgi:hypothetical protein
MSRRKHMRARAHGYALPLLAALPLVLNSASMPTTTATFTDGSPGAGVDEGALVAPGSLDVQNAATLDLVLPGQGGRPATVTVTSPKGTRTVSESARGVHDIPEAAVQAYQRAAAVLAEVSPACQLPWTLLAGIGRVESDHGRYAGAVLGNDGVSNPLIIGVPLNGVGPVAAIRDTDQGKFDGDTVWDRAVGPMQFIPSTWDAAGVDGDGDGVRTPNDIDDAALAAGVYLCAGAADLQSPDRMSAAIHRYNNSDSYTALVMAYEQSYRTGDFTVNITTSTVLGVSGFTPHSTAIPPAVKKDAVEAVTAVKEIHKAASQPVDMTGSPIKPHLPGTPVAATGPQPPAVTPTPLPTEPSTGPADNPSPTPSPAPSADPTPGPGTTSPDPSPGPGTTSPDPSPGPGTTSPDPTPGPDTTSPDPSPGPGTTSPDPSPGPDTTSPDPSPGPDTTSPDPTPGPDTTSPDPTPGPDPTPTQDPTPDPTPTPDPPPAPDPTPEPPANTSESGTLESCGAGFCLGGQALDAGDTAATAAADLDGDGSVEGRGDELAGLVGSTVTLTVDKSAGWALLAINGKQY